MFRLNNVRCRDIIKIKELYIEEAETTWTLKISEIALNNRAADRHD